MGAKVSSFWNKHLKKDKKIFLNVRCTPEVKELIQPSEIFECRVILEQPENWSLSYGQLLGAYRRQENALDWNAPYLNLWLYDVTEPIHLELLVPWLDGQYTCVRTENKKAWLFDTSDDTTSVQVIGNCIQ